MAAQLINLFAKITLMMGLGFLLTKTGIMTEDMKKNLSKLLIEAVLPASILSSAFQPFHKEHFHGMLIVFGISILYYSVSLLIMILASKYLNKGWDFKSVFINLIVFANVGFIGFPLLNELFGKLGTLYGVPYNIAYVLFFFTIGVYLMELGNKKSGKKKFINRIIIISVFSIILYLLPFRLPDFVGDTLSTIGGMMIPLSMMIIGWEIAEMNFTSVFTDIYSYIVSLLRLLVLPLIMIFILAFFKLDKTVATTIVLLTALPSGSLVVVLSGEKNCDTKLAARGVAQTTVLMLITVPALLLIAEYFL